MKRKYLFFLLFPLSHSIHAQDLSDSVTGVYITRSLQTWEERDEGNGMTVFETLDPPLTLQENTFTINCDGTFSVYSWGRETYSMYAMEYYGKTFWRTGTWTVSHDTLTLHFKMEEVYEYGDRSNLIEKRDLEKLFNSAGKRYGDPFYARRLEARWKVTGPGKLCWKLENYDNCIERNK